MSAHPFRIPQALCRFFSLTSLVWVLSVSSTSWFSLTALLLALEKATLSQSYLQGFRFQLYQFLPNESPALQVLALWEFPRNILWPLWFSIPMQQTSKPDSLNQPPFTYSFMMCNGLWAHFYSTQHWTSLANFGLHSDTSSYRLEAFS